LYQFYNILSIRVNYLKYKEMISMTNDNLNETVNEGAKEIALENEKVNESVNEDSMADYMTDLDSSMKRINEGDILKGTVISVSDDEVLVNIGFMSDGIVQRSELSHDGSVNPKDALKAGDEIYVYVLEVNDGEGNVALSKKLADSLKIWEDLEATYSNGATMNVTVSEVVKGGVTANLNGVRAFIPASQLSMNYVENLNDFLGKTLEVKVIEFDKDKKKVVLSRKEIEKVAAEKNKDQVWATIKKGEKRSGKVTRLAKFGAFVDLGGIDGLIHLSELSWKRVNDPSEVVSVGDEVEVYVLDFDKAKQRISLGLKDVSENPWNKGIGKFKAGDVLEGTIVKLLDFGAFVEIEAGVQGLVHISEISEDRIAKPSDVLKVGDKVKVKVLEINKENQKIGLSIKEAQNNNSAELMKYADKGDASVTIGDLFKDKLKGFKFE
jgi:small subunit ribosomal protein S1